MRNVLVVAALAAVGVASAPVAAAPLARLVPNDTLVYVGVRGGARLQQQYAESRTRAIMHAMHVRMLIATVMKKATAHMGRSGRQTEQQVMQLLHLAERCHSALSFSMHLKDRTPMPRIIVAMRGGANAAKVRTLMTALAAKINKSPRGSQPAHAAVYQAHRCEVLQINSGEKTDRFAADGGLAASHDFSYCMKQVQPRAAAVAYVNTRAVLALFKSSVRQNSDAQDKKTLRVVMKSLGLHALGGMAFSYGFDGKDYRSDVFVAVAQGSKRLRHLLGLKPLAKKYQRLVPRTAVAFSILRVNLAGWGRQLLKLLKITDPRGAAHMRQFRAQFRKIIGISLQRDLLVPLSGVWASYQARDASGIISGLVFVHPLARPKRFSLTLDKLLHLARARLHASGVPVGIVSERANKLRYHMLSLPLGMGPSIAVAHGSLYISSEAQALADAANGGFGKESILHNKAFLALRKRLGVPPAKAGAYTFLQTGPVFRNTLAYVRQVILPLLKSRNVVPQSVSIPSFREVMPYLTPNESAAWSDAAGYHQREIGPAPGIGMLSGTSAINPASVGLLAAIMLPGLAKARAFANRAVSSNNLRQIAVSCALYQQSHNKFPPALANLVADGQLTTKTLVRPGSGHSALHVPAADARNLGWIKAHLRGHCDYVYVGAGIGAVTSDANASKVVVAYEKRHEVDRGRAVAFGDMHARWVSAADWKSVLSADRRARRADHLPLMKGAAPVRVAP